MDLSSVHSVVKLDEDVRTIVDDLSMSFGNLIVQYASFQRLKAIADEIHAERLNLEADFYTTKGRAFVREHPAVLVHGTPARNS